MKIPHRRIRTRVASFLKTSKLSLLDVHYDISGRICISLNGKEQCNIRLPMRRARELERKLPEVIHDWDYGRRIKGFNVLALTKRRASKHARKLSKPGQ